MYILNIKSLRKRDDALKKLDNLLGILQSNIKITLNTSMNTDIEQSRSNSKGIPGDEDMMIDSGIQFSEDETSCTFDPDVLDAYKNFDSRNYEDGTAPEDKTRELETPEGQEERKVNIDTEHNDSLIRPEVGRDSGHSEVYDGTKGCDLSSNSDSNNNHDELDIDQAKHEGGKDNSELMLILQNQDNPDGDVTWKCHCGKTFANNKTGLLSHIREAHKITLNTSDNTVNISLVGEEMLIESAGLGTKFGHSDTFEFVRGGESHQAPCSKDGESKVEEKENKFKLSGCRKKKRVRTFISDVQRSLLKNYYSLNQLPNEEEYTQISKAVGHPLKVVRQWFTNERRNDIDRRKRMLSGSSLSSNLIKEEQAVDLKKGKDIISRDEEEGERFTTDIEDPTPGLFPPKKNLDDSSYSSLRALLDDSESD